ncbi:MULTISPECIES: hypothetical protein [unclassified Rhizobium]|uniref:hypothetical protein n=1 Tax=unclassified Rhizobium TaxID=2613769 RepID=UPI000A4CEC61|nr:MULTISPECIES: hypothetical protein [unclassified Rhizobium]TCM52279.1 hypothetical protein C8J36_109160 [Rhizobium sp. PP-F2F-G48]
MTRRLSRFRHAVLPRLDRHEACRGTTIIIGMVFVLGAVAALSEALAILFASD